MVDDGIKRLEVLRDFRRETSGKAGDEVFELSDFPLDLIECAVSLGSSLRHGFAGVEDSLDTLCSAHRSVRGEINGVIRCVEAERMARMLMRACAPTLPLSGCKQKTPDPKLPDHGEPDNRPTY